MPVVSGVVFGTSSLAMMDGFCVSRYVGLEGLWFTFELCDIVISSRRVGKSVTTEVWRWRCKYHETDFTTGEGGEGGVL